MDQSPRDLTDKRSLAKTELDGGNQTLLPAIYVIQIFYPEARISRPIMCKNMFEQSYGMHSHGVYFNRGRYNCSNPAVLPRSSYK